MGRRRYHANEGADPLVVLLGSAGLAAVGILAYNAISKKSEQAQKSNAKQLSLVRPQTITPLSEWKRPPIDANTRIPRELLAAGPMVVSQLANFVPPGREVALPDGSRGLNLDLRPLIRFAGILAKATTTTDAQGWATSPVVTAMNASASWSDPLAAEVAARASAHVFRDDKIAEFQRREGLTPDGFYGNRTAIALGKYGSPVPAPYVGTAPPKPAPVPSIIQTPSGPQTVVTTQPPDYVPDPPLVMQCPGDMDPVWVPSQKMWQCPSLSTQPPDVLVVDPTVPPSKDEIGPTGMKAGTSEQTWELQFFDKNKAIRNTILIAMLPAAIGVGAEALPVVAPGLAASTGSVGVGSWTTGATWATAKTAVSIATGAGGIAQAVIKVVDPKGSVF